MSYIFVEAKFWRELNMHWLNMYDIGVDSRSMRTVYVRRLTRYCAKRASITPHRTSSRYLQFSLIYIIFSWLFGTVSTENPTDYYCWLNWACSVGPVLLAIPFQDVGANEWLHSVTVIIGWSTRSPPLPWLLTWLYLEDRPVNVMCAEVQSNTTQFNQL